MSQIIKLREVIDGDIIKWYDGDTLIEKYDDSEDDEIVNYIKKNGFYIYDATILKLFINNIEILKFDMFNNNFGFYYYNTDSGCFKHRDRYVYHIQGYFGVL